MTDLNRIKQNVSKMATMNAPEADIDGYIASEGVTVDDVRNHQIEAQDQGIGSRIIKDYAGRLSEGQQALDAHDRGEQGAPLTALDYLGKVGFGTANDAIGEVAKSAAGYIPQGVKDAVSSGLVSLSDTAPGRMAMGAAHYVGDQYKDIAQRYPNATRHVEAAANIGGMLAPQVPIKGTSLAGTAVGAASKTGRFLKEAGQDLIKAPESLPATVSKSLGKQAKEAARSDYNVFDEIGGGLHRDQVVDFSNSINSLRPKDPAKAAIWDRSGVKDSMDTINSAINGGELSFSGAHALRADVNSQLKMAYMAGDSTKASHLMQIKDKLTDVLTDPNNASHLDIKAKNAWQSANHEFAKGSLLEDLELIAAKASGKAQPANSLDTAINNFLNNPKLSGSLQANERAALEDVVKKTQKGELLRASAGRIMPAAGAALGGVPGFLVGHYGSQLSRTTAEALKLRKLDKVYELINNRAAPEALTHKPPLMLTHDRRGTLEMGIGQRKTYEASKGLSGAPINMGETKQLALPSPDMPTPSGVGITRSSSAPMNGRQLKIAKIMMERDMPVTNEVPMRTPVSQSLKLEDAPLTTSRRTQLNNLRAKLINGEISQNKFTDTAAKSFELNQSQARSLAREIMRDSKK